jgi:polysaccharide chain length determinant protein (PEP-CTERM system associated)
VLPGKKYKPEDFVNIIWRYKWLLVVPVLLGTLIAVVVGRRMPNRYMSETLVLVVPQRVPSEYVRSTVTTKIEDRVRTIREQILSRSRLERIVEELNLYPELRREATMEEVIDEMRRNVNTRVVRDDAFTVSFVADTPERAQKVTERLAGMFSEENMRDREVQAESTNQFLQTQVEDARQRLTEREKRVEEYRLRYSGELPEQMQSNLQAIQNAELQIQTLTQSLNSDRATRLLLDRQIADASSPETPFVPPPNSPQPPQGAPTLAQQLEVAEANVRALETRLTPQHPDLLQARAAVRRLQAQISQQLATTTTLGAPGPAVEPRLSSAELARRNRLKELQGQLDAIDRQITQKLDDEKRLRAIVADYRARIEAAPRRQTELVSLTRDYETLQNQYRSLLGKYEDSKVAANLERRQIGEQLRILDPASRPERPFKPKRPLIAAGGAAVGLVLGLGLMGFFEFTDRTLRSSDDVALCCTLPVLAALPKVHTAAELKHARRTRGLAWVAASALGVMATVMLVLWRARF